MKQFVGFAVLLTIVNILFEWQSCAAEIIFVPDDSPTVQSALDQTQNGDTVVAQPGTYREILYIPGHDVTLAGRFLFTGDTSDIALCVLRPPAETEDGRNIYALESGITTLLHVVGLTIGGGVPAMTLPLGGLDVMNRALVLDHCVLDSSSSLRGGAASIRGGSATFRNSRVRYCGSNGIGTALDLRETRVSLERCSITQDRALLGNTADVVRLAAGNLILDECALSGLGISDLPGRVFLSSSGDSCTVKIAHCTIAGNRFQHFFGAAGRSYHIAFDSNVVSHNEFFQDVLISHMADTGLAAFFRGNLFIENTNLSSPGFGGRMFFTLVGSHRTVEITGNLFLRNHNRENSVLTMGDDSLARFTVRGNYIIENSHDAIANPPGGVLMLIGNRPADLRYNVIMNNRGHAAFDGFDIFQPGYAIHNYWGHASGPYDSVGNPLGQGDTVEYRIVYDPWEPDTAFMDTTESVRESRSAPMDFVIGYAFPNPFNAQVTIEFAVTRTLPVRVEIFDLLGRHVTTLADDVRDLGIHRVTWNASDQASGIYFACLSSSVSQNTMQVKKLILLK